MGRDYTN